MQFSVSPEIFAHSPDLAIGIMPLHDFDNTKADPAIEQLLRAAEESVRSQLDLDTFREHPHIAALQAVHRSFDSNPNKFPPSIQALAKRILKGSQLPSINPIVDLYNTISLKYILPAGAEDLDKTTGDIRLAPADGTEDFLPLGETESSPPSPGEWVYKDDAGVICRKLNWREGQRTMTTAETTNVVCVIEGFPPVGQETLQQALEELQQLAAQFCGGQSHVQLITRDQPAVEL